MNIDKLNNLLELFYTQYKKNDVKDVFLTSLKNNQTFSWEDTYKSIVKLSNEISLIIKKGDRCLLLSENRPEWLISDLSIMLSNGITVPSYTTYTERDYEYIIDDCEPSLLIISNKDLFQKVKKIIKKKIFIKAVISFDKIEDSDIDILYLNSILEKNYNDKSFFNLDIKRKDTSCIIYTSGTQGNPKGVMLSHGGILNNCEGSYKLLEQFVSERPNFLTWLPLSHFMNIQSNLHK